MKSYGLKLKIVFMLILFFGIFGLAKSSWAATYYVAITGIDSNPGTQSQPWRTIQRSADVMVAGDTVMVGAGIYNERVITAHAGTDSSHYIAFKTTTSAQILGFNIEHAYVRVEGFTVTNTNGQTCDDSCDCSQNTYGGVRVGADYAQVVGNHFLNIGCAAAVANERGATPSYVLVDSNHMEHCQYGVNISGSYWTVTNNNIERLYAYSRESSYDADYIRFFGDHHLIKNNWMHGTIGGDANGYGGEIAASHTDCIQTFDQNDNYSTYITIDGNVCSESTSFMMIQADGYHHSHDIYIMNNVAYNPISNSEFAGDVGINMRDFYNVWIVGNTFRGKGGVYIHEMWAGRIYNVTIKNNIMDMTGDSGYHYAYAILFSNLDGLTELALSTELARFRASVDADYNLLTNSYIDSASNYTCPPYACHDKTVTDSLFVDRANPLGTDGRPFTADDGLRLQSVSPAIDSGADLSSLATASALDILGNSRSSSWDIGAYEYVQGGDTTPPAAPTGLSVN